MRVRVLLLAVALLGAACEPALTVTATSPTDSPPAPASEPPTDAFTAEQVQFLATMAWRDAEARAFLEHVAAVRAAVPPLLRTVRWCEAGRYLGLPHPETNYQARTHGEDGASGGYQMLASTWRAWAAAAGVDVSAWPSAYLAPDWVQDQVATYGYQTHGTAPWTPSRSCWA